MHKADSLTIDSSQTHPLKTFAFWRNLFLFYYAFSILGHFLEVIYSLFEVHILGRGPFIPKLPSAAPLAPPYGIAIVVLILLAVPLLKLIKQRLAGLRHRRLQSLFFVLAAFLVTSLIMVATEIISGFFCIAIWGSNPFWTYSGPLAFFDGTIYLPNTLLFGLVGTLTLFFLIPPTQKLLDRTNQRALTAIFWVLLVTYAADLTWTLLHSTF
jgi:uncharacterized membrane protein